MSETLVRLRYFVIICEGVHYMTVVYVYVFLSCMVIQIIV